MKYITILDFTTGEIHIHKDKVDLYESLEDLIEELGYNSSNCEWMTSDTLKLQIH